MSKSLSEINIGRTLIQACALPVMFAIGSDAAAACMSKSPASKTTTEVRISVLVPAGAVNAYRAAGYSVSSCPENKEELKKIVQHYCGSNRSTGVPARIHLMIYGFSREQLCSSARSGLSEVN